MSSGLYALTLIVIAATCVLIFSVRAWATFQGARTGEAREEAYRSLASRCAATQSESASQLAAVQDELTRIVSRLAAIEGVLKSVE